MRKKSKFHTPKIVPMTFTELVRFILLTTVCFSEKDTNVLIRLITDGDEIICEKKIKAFIEADSTCIELKENYHKEESSQWYR